MKNAVIIAAIRPIKGGASQLELRQEIVRENQGSSLNSLLMKGHPGFGVQKPTVSWQNVSAKQMANFHFEVGHDMSEYLGFEVNLQVQESADPSKLWTPAQFTFLNKLGVKTTRLPKINPQTQEILCLNNKPIFRKVILVKGEAKHEYIQHNSVIVQQAKVMPPNVAAVLADGE